MIIQCPKCNSLHIKKIVSHKDRGDEYFCEACQSRIMENAGYRRLSSQQIQLIFKLREEGISMRGIARILGCTYQAISVQLKKSMNELKMDTQNS